MNKTNVVVLISALLIIGMPHANAFNVTSSSTDNELFEIITTLSQYGIENCTNPESPIYDSSVVKAYGNVPSINNATQLNEFTGKLRYVREKSWNEIDFYPNGSIVRYGSDPSRGYFLIELYDDGEGNYSEEDTREIYNIVEKYAVIDGVEDIPVVFTLTKETDIIGFVEYPVYRYDIDNKTTEEYLSGINSSMNNTNNTSLHNSQSMPLSGILTSLLVIVLAYTIIKKE
ncbi:MAG: hypothetical protein PWQ51_2351 [Methanolobus sp.]|jgi:hypothetical protein|uniref:hypothetical protein n=1 Tax=Methanolobus sp. TaxID=1874737 RepID=UPI0024AA492E|nr:hypothetical protein [Methanolobus sp.]MDI3486324.1 hypothetical protein [Methanolobus sp.]MDK2825361.1 hypothetical protein [Methanolobus sp.]MDK2832292.1 hypothetical protein [Methanolobus sp.]MDK2940186.1 hypothetical protein [Methanolobus sp.]MDK2947809.1 hypothetical protein [Methanolobus sp.]